MSDNKARYAEMHGRLKEHGLLPKDDPGWFVSPFESGHWSYFHIPDSSPDWHRPNPSPNWHMDLHHPGDPEGSIVRTDLGSDDSMVPERAMRELRNRDVVHAMGEQWKRAAANGDPHGDNPDARAVHPSLYPENVSHLFRNYP